MPNIHIIYWLNILIHMQTPRMIRFCNLLNSFCLLAVLIIFNGQSGTITTRKAPSDVRLI